MTLYNFIIILSSVILNASAQLFLKAGTNSLNHVFNQNEGVFHLLFKVFLDPHILGGLACYVISVGIWIYALSKVDVGLAYPMLSIGYVINVFAAWYLFGEDISLQKLIGIGAIIVGVIVLSRS